MKISPANIFLIPTDAFHLKDVPKLTRLNGVLWEEQVNTFVLEDLLDKCHLDYSYF